MNTKNIKFYKYNISIEGNEKLNKLINRIESDNIEPVKINNEVIKIETCIASC
jgi:hypothetical protein